MTRHLQVGTWLAMASAAIASACSLEIVDTLIGASPDQAADAETGATLGDDDDGDGDGDGDAEGGDDHGDEGAGSPIFDVGEAESTLSCAFAAQFPSHIGCEFYGVDLDGPGLFEQDPFGFVVINPLSDPVEVTLERHTANGWALVESRMITGSDEVVLLPGDSEVHGTGLYDHATLRVTGTAPIIVIQASPAQGQGHSASATMLQPTAAWSSHVTVAGWRTHPGVGEPSFLSIVAQTSGTSVAVRPVFEIANIPPSWAPFVEIIDPDAEPPTILVTLPVEPGELLRLDATAIDAAEVDHGTSGTTVESGQEHLISVFSAHTCAAIPDFEGSCGHMQEQLSPHLIGTRFVGPRLVAAAVEGLGPDAELGHERTMIQVAATEPNTEVVFSYLDDQGVVVELDAVLMDPDEPYAIYEYDHELSVSSDRPIIAAAYMTNAELTGLGSASMVQLAPVDQWTGSHWVWVPEGFETHLLVTSTPSAAVEVEWLSGLDGDDAPQPAALLEASQTAAPGAGPWMVRRFAVEPGIYRVQSSSRASVVVSGWAPADGFAYLAGWGPSLADLDPAG